MKRFELMLLLLLAWPCFGGERAVQIGLLNRSYLHAPLQSNSQLFSPGISGTYEFILNPSFLLGVHLGYTRMLGEKINAGQLIYGLMMKHYFNENASFRPYASYGLLMSVFYPDDQEGSAHSHNTRLCLGADWNIWNRMFFELAYHYNRVRYFSLPRIGLDAFELRIGWRLVWKKEES